MKDISMETISANAKPKEPWVAVLFNQLLPGTGYFYVKAYVKGWFVTLGIITAYSVLSFYITKIMLNPNTKILPFFSAAIPVAIMLGLLESIFRILISIDSGLTAERYNRSRGFTKANIGLRVFAIIGTFIFFFFPVPALSTAIFLRTNISQVYKIPTATMAPVIKPGDEIVTDKLIYKNTLPQRGDVAIFIAPDDRRKVYVKRVIGLPGEILEIKDGSIYINNVKISESRISKNYYYNAGEYGKENKKVKIPVSNYFLMGDNSNNSLDSRFFGFVPLKDIKSKVIKIFYPPERAGKIE